MEEQMSHYPKFSILDSIPPQAWAGPRIIHNKPINHNHNINFPCINLHTPNIKDWYREEVLAEHERELKLAWANVNMYKLLEDPAAAPLEINVDYPPIEYTSHADNMRDLAQELTNYTTGLMADEINRLSREARAHKEKTGAWPWGDAAVPQIDYIEEAPYLPSLWLPPFEFTPLPTDVSIPDRLQQSTDSYMKMLSEFGTFILKLLDDLPAIARENLLGFSKDLTAFADMLSTRQARAEEFISGEARDSGKMDPPKTIKDGLGEDYSGAVNTPIDDAELAKSLKSRFTPNRFRIANDLTQETKALASLSPRLKLQMEDGPKQNIIYGPEGEGTYIFEKLNIINIDSSKRDDPIKTVRSLAHELGHKDGPVVDDESLRSCMDSEGAAVLNVMIVREEILANGGPDIGIAGGSPYEEDYLAIYEDYKSGIMDYKQAIRKIGEIYENEPPSIGSYPTYRALYTSRGAR